MKKKVPKADTIKTDTTVFDEPLPIIQVDSNYKSDISSLFNELQSAVFMVYAYEDDNHVQGSGFFLTAEGIGITNYHVLQEFPNWLIKTSNGQVFEITEVLNYSKPDDLDYVIFKVDDRGFNFDYLKMANKKSKVGDNVFVISSPYGLENSLTKGTISQIRDSKYYQIDATIAPGSSGGALFNMDGEVIGLINMGFEGSALNFGVDIQLIPYKKHISPPN